MKNKIQKIYETTNNSELKSLISDLFSSQVDLNDRNIQKYFLQKIGDIKNLSIDEKNFIDSLNKIVLVETLYISDLISILNENSEKLTKYPEFSYLLSNLKNINNSNVAYKYIYEVINAIEPYRLINEINDFYKKINQVVENNKELIYLMNVRDYLSEKSLGDFYKDVISVVESYIYNSCSKNSLMETLNRYKYEKIFETIHNELEKLDNKFNINSTEDFVVEDLYSFVYIDENQNLYFMNNSELFVKNGENINIVEENTIPKILRDINNYIYSDNVKLSENEIKIYLNENVLKINTETKNITVNNREINDIEMVKSYILESGLKNHIHINDLNLIETIVDYLPLYVKLDFAKKIKNINTNENATIFNFDTKFYLNLNTNENQGFYTNLNIYQIKNFIQENLKFELKGDSYHYFVENKEAIRISKQCENINKETIELQKRFDLINNSEIDITEKEAIKEIILQKINELSYLQKDLNVKLYELQNISEDEINKFKLNDMVRIVDSGVIGKIISINQTTKEISILNDENDTIEVTVSQIVNVKDEINDAMNINKKKLLN